MAPSATAATPEGGVGGVEAEGEVEIALGGDLAKTPLVLGYGALPGGIHVPSAEALPVGTISVATLAGYGHKTGLLSATHKLNRGIGDLAVAYQATDFLAVGLSLDGRYDRHYGVVPSGDDGWVGDPRILVRASHRAGAIAFGAQLGLWIPGKNAPSVSLGATSIDARGLVSFAAGPAVLSLEGGYRLDKSSKSVDDATRLTVQDQVSLGVSAYSAFVAGARLMLPIGGGFVAVEGSAEFFTGTGAPSGILRGGLGGGVHLTPAWTVLGFAEVAKDPSIAASAVSANMIPLIAYEPGISVGVGLAARFGGPSAIAKKTFVVDKNPKGTVKIDVPKYAAVLGQVTDEGGGPIVGGKVTVTVGDKIGKTNTDDKGGYKIGELPIANARVDVEVDGKKPGSATLALKEGDNAVPTIKLEAKLPDGQVRGIVRGFANGKAVVGATVALDPSGATATTGADGTFVINIPPGQYKLTVTATGLKPQSLDVTVDPDGVSIKNIDLRK